MSHYESVFTAHRNVLATVIPSVCLSVRLSVTLRYYVKTTARSTVQFALLDSKMCLVLYKLKKYSPGTTPSPEILARTDLPPPDSSKSGQWYQYTGRETTASPWNLGSKWPTPSRRQRVLTHLPRSTSTERDRKRSPITLNKNSTRAFQRAINQGPLLPLTFQNGDKVPKFVVFWTISIIKDEKSATKFHSIKMSAAKL